MSRRLPSLTHRRGFAATIAIVAIISLSAAGVGRAATLRVDRACYVLSRTIPSMKITGAGYAPRSHVLITSSANLDASTTANGAGEISVKLRAPAPAFSVPSVKRFVFRAKDFTTHPAVVAHITVRVAPLGALHGATPRARGLKALSERTSWSFSGFVPGHEIYAHYTLGGRQVAVQAFGVAHGACGTLHARAPLYPATPHHASYPVQFDSAYGYSRRTAPRLSGRVSLDTAL